MSAWLEFDYPKIPVLGDVAGPCVVFEKLDGTNLGWPWTRGFGFGPPGTRRLPLSRRDPALREAFGAFKRIAETLDRTLARRTRANRAKAFLEFLGPGSFAGLHVPGERKRLVLIDVALEGEGLMGPFEFLDAFEGQGVEIPRVLYRGSSPGRAVSDALSGKAGVAEGVMVKGGKTGSAWAGKLKTEEWKRRLAEAAREGRWTAADGIERTLEEEF